jgi:hypothetical protein
MKFISKIHYNPKLRQHFFVIERAILEKFHVEKDENLFSKRFVIKVNNKVNWRGGSTVLGEGRSYISISKARMKELNVELDDEISIELEKDYSEFGMDVPVEFQEILHQDPEANARFSVLTKGIQRATIYIVNKLKTSEKRIEKSIFLLENLKKAPKNNTTMRQILGKDLP